MRAQIVGAVHAAGADGDGASAKMPGTRNVVWRVADNYELRRLKFHPQVPRNALSGERRKIASIVRLFAEGARQSEESERPTSFIFKWAAASILPVSRAD